VAKKTGSLRILALTMLAGSIYDWAMGLLILFTPGFITGLFGLPFPTDLMYFRAGGMVFVTLPFFYLLAYENVERNIAVVPAAIVVRFLGFAFFVIHVLLLDAPPILILIGFADLAFAIVHYVFLKRSGYGLRRCNALSKCVAPYLTQRRNHERLHGQAAGR